MTDMAELPWPKAGRRKKSTHGPEGTPGTSGRESGFTLLEVLVSMVVLVFISFGIYEAVTQTYRLRDILSQEGDFYNSIRLAMNIVQRDVSLMYSPANIVPTPTASGAPAAGGFGTPPAAAAPQTGDLAQEWDYWGPAMHKTGIRPMRFKGSDSKISFVASSHLRVYKDSQESEFAKIEYSIGKDDEDASLSMLIKTESTDVWEDQERNDTTTRSFRLLHGIKTLKFVFWQKRDGELKSVNSWDSDQDPNKGIFPDMIQINLEVNGPEKLNFSGQYNFRPEFPLNGLDPST